jgi:protein ImuB
MRDQPTRVVVVQFPHWSAYADALGCSARSAFEPVVRAVVAHVPLVEVTAPGIIVFATRGPSRHAGGDDALAALVRAAIQRQLGAAHDTGAAHGTGTARPRFGIGIADGRLAAAIAAQHSLHTGTPHVVAPGASRNVLADTPVHALVQCVEVIGAVGAGVPGADDVASYREVVSLLQRLGLYRFGDVATLSEADLIARLGAFGRDLFRLAHGMDRHPPLTVAPPPDRVCSHQFDSPVESRDAVLAIVDQLATAVVGHLVAHGLSVVRLHVSLESDHGERSERMWYRADGWSAGAIIESVRWQLDAWVQHDAPTSGVVGVRLSPEQMVIDAGRQASLWGGERDGDRHAQRAIRRVVDMHGAESVTIPTWRGGRDPARWFEFVRSDAVDLERRVAREVAMPVAWRGSLPSPAPSLVFDAEPDAHIDVHGTDGRPVGVTSRHAMSDEPAVVRMGSATYDVLAWAGPWPVEERWWDVRRARRAVRLQLLLRERGTEQTRAMIAVLEHHVWRRAAWYA